VSAANCKNIYVYSRAARLYINSAQNEGMSMGLTTIDATEMYRVDGGLRQSRVHPGVAHTGRCHAENMAL